MSLLAELMISFGRCKKAQNFPCERDVIFRLDDHCTVTTEIRDEADIRPAHNDTSSCRFRNHHAASFVK